MRDDRVRCPECGRRTDLFTLASDLVARRTYERRRFHSRMTALALVALAAATQPLLSGCIGPAAIESWLAFATTPLAALLGTYLVLVLVYLSYFLWTSVRGVHRLLFAVITTLALVLVPAPASLLVAAAWWQGFATWVRFDAP